MQELSVDELAAKLQNEPLFLVQIIAQNAQEDVSAQLKSIGQANGTLPASDIIDIFKDLAPSLTSDEIVRLLSVEFNPDADNVTSDYRPVLEERRMELQQQGTLAGMNWGSLYEGTLRDYRATILDFVGVDDPAAKPKNKANPRTGVKGRCGCTSCAKRDRNFMLAGLAFFLIVMLGIATKWK